MDGGKILLAIMALASVVMFFDPAMAGQGNHPELKVATQVGQASTGAPSVVVLSEVPRATTAQTRPAARARTTGSSIPRPQTGLTEAQWKALKEQAAKFPDPNGRSPPEKVLTPSPSR